MVGVAVLSLCNCGAPSFFFVPQTNVQQRQGVVRMVRCCRCVLFGSHIGALVRHWGKISIFATMGVLGVLGGAVMGRSHAISRGRASVHVLWLGTKARSERRCGGKQGCHVLHQYGFLFAIFVDLCVEVNDFWRLSWTNTFVTFAPPPQDNTLWPVHHPATWSGLNSRSSLPNTSSRRSI